MSIAVQTTDRESISMQLKRTLRQAVNLVLPEEDRLTLPPRQSRLKMESGIVLRKPQRIPTGRTHVFLISETQTLEEPETKFGVPTFSEDGTPNFPVDLEPEPIGFDDDGLCVYSTGAIETAIQHGCNIYLVNDSLENTLGFWDSSDIPEDHVIDAFTFEGTTYKEKMQNAFTFLYGKLGRTEFVGARPPPWENLYRNLANCNIGIGTVFPELIVQ